MWQALDIGTWLAGRRSDLDRVKGPVSEIIGRVRAEGDAALLDLTKKFDGIDLAEIAVTEEEREAAYDEVDAELVASLVEAEERISRFHELQRGRDLWLQEVEPGITLGVKTTPLSRIGAYVPGGRAAYPSTALMCTIPAKVAGVAEICCCTPPPTSPITLVALDIAGIDEIYRVGGAQAIAAMALGTESIPRVEKIVGPGNVYVTAAKMLLRDEAEIDFPAGPSEIAILADETANPTFVAADVLAQAEHDPNSACVLVTTDAAVADAVGAEVKRMAATAQRRDIIAKALEHSGYIVAADLDEAVATVNGVAPEHLSIQVADPLAVLNRIRSAGSIFVGPYAAVACGDYASGTNHVLPTAGYASLYSGLDVNHFCRRSTVQVITREGLDAIGDVVETIADAEGLHAHAESVRVRRRG
ncbi:histidinol dehydrogenase [Methanoculleus sp. Afa-1]|uniref:Histidinol dehydrogenase n=1 Tax=Methanoculleus formosensis TaxID=2590886 RepID=A0A9E4ZLZ7_9EURY|nr:histidinol dehydrogenase [Methanoculleus sp. Afa-1]MCT8336775.1 histidinol dehydrogenase [Methanoculleus sp. Afa-1]